MDYLSISILVGVIVTIGAIVVVTHRQWLNENKGK